jgi:hypothetical protein
MLPFDNLLGGAQLTLAAAFLSDPLLDQNWCGLRVFSGRGGRWPLDEIDRAPGPLYEAHPAPRELCAPGNLSPLRRGGPLGGNVSSWMTRFRASDNRMY